MLHTASYDYIAKIKKLSGVMLGLNNLLGRYHVFYQKLNRLYRHGPETEFEKFHHQLRQMNDSTSKNINKIIDKMGSYGEIPGEALKEYYSGSRKIQKEDIVHPVRTLEEMILDIEKLFSIMAEIETESKKSGDKAAGSMINSMQRSLKKDYWVIIDWWYNVNTREEFSKQLV